jgi:dihydrofolate reductase
LTIEAYVIVSANGMLADTSGVMPEALKFPADQSFFENALDAADLIVHGRHSHEDQKRSAQRRRVVVTSRVSTLAKDDALPHATLWNPAGATFAEACAAAGVKSSAKIAIIGGPAVYQLFLDRYDVFWLSQAHRVQIENGLGVFPDVPASTPQQILTSHGLRAKEKRMLDRAANVDLTAWRRS